MTQRKVGSENANGKQSENEEGPTLGETRPVFVPELKRRLIQETVDAGQTCLDVSPSHDYVES